MFDVAISSDSTGFVFGVAEGASTTAALASDIFVEREQRECSVSTMVGMWRLEFAWQHHVRRINCRIHCTLNCDSSDTHNKR